MLRDLLPIVPLAALCWHVVMLVAFSDILVAAVPLFRHSAEHQDRPRRVCRPRVDLSVNESHVLIKLAPGKAVWLAVSGSECADVRIMHVLPLCIFAEGGHFTPCFCRQRAVCDYLRVAEGGGWGTLFTAEPTRTRRPPIGRLFAAKAAAPPLLFRRCFGFFALSALCSETPKNHKLRRDVRSSLLLPEHLEACIFFIQCHGTHSI